MHGFFDLDEIKEDFAPSLNLSTSHTLSLCFLCVFVAQSQKSDLIATVLAGKLIPEHPVFCFMGFFFAGIWKTGPAQVQYQVNEPGLSRIFNLPPLRCRRPAAVGGGAEAAEELHEAAEEAEQRAERAAQEAREEGERVAGKGNESWETETKTNKSK